MNKLLLYIISFYIASSVGNGNYPQNVEMVLKKSGKNRIELEKAIKYFQKSEDPLKLKAVYFLISNMDIHYSINYYWADQNGKRLPFNELNYKTFDDAIKAFNELKAKVPHIHPVQIRYADIDSIKSAFLIKHIETSFETWKKTRTHKLSFQTFCEYILPYRIADEPQQDWQEIYKKRFSSISSIINTKPINDVLFSLATDQKKWFTNTWAIEKRNEPLPRLGPLQLLLEKKGNCDDIADLQVFILRSQGYPVTIDNVPYWATSTGQHFFNVTFDKSFKTIPFDISTASVKIDNFSREPSKVIRIMFSKQKNVLATLEKSDNIPAGFMRAQNYLDVTKEYWRTTDVVTEIINNPFKKNIAFVSVFNNLSWKPTWWGRIKENSAVFKDMSKGVVYLPETYNKARLAPAGYPIAVGYEHQLVLRPDLNNRHNVLIKEQNKYLTIRTGKKYRLFYWDNSWKLAGVQQANLSDNRLMFANVPKNALRILLPEKTQKKERPFIMSEDNQIVWF